MQYCQFGLDVMRTAIYSRIVGDELNEEERGVLSGDYAKLTEHADSAAYFKRNVDGKGRAIFHFRHQIDLPVRA